MIILYIIALQTRELSQKKNELQQQIKGLYTYLKRMTVAWNN